VLVLPRLGRGDAEDEGEASEYRGQEFDHDGATTPSCFRHHVLNASDANRSIGDIAILVIGTLARLLRCVGVYYDALELASDLAP
jgi:hypothetical protein